jgi:D-beta-D-heptose 7-phosphate kinase/D-beta-D-heptose 1-phosphate adenosyltransferase
MIALRPDVIVKGGEFVADEIVGAPEVRSWGGRVRIVPFVDGFSTSKLIARAALPERS